MLCRYMLHYVKNIDINVIYVYNSAYKYICMHGNILIGYSLDCIKTICFHQNYTLLKNIYYMTNN